MARLTREQHLFGPGPKRILALDGGGIRGVISLGILKAIETLLAARAPNKEDFRLAHYFDLIAGTSTGSPPGPSTGPGSGGGSSTIRWRFPWSIW